MIGKPAATTLVSTLLLAATTLADPPQINGTGPFGTQRGVATDVTFNGANLAGNPQLLAPFPFSIEAAPGSDAANWKAKLTVAPGTAVGVYPIRVKTDEGISNPFLFAVGQVPQVGEAEDNSTFETAQAVAAPVVVEGQSAGNDVDFFKFPGKAGQRIVVDAQCARIGSGVDPAIRLTTASRKFIASAEDTAGLMTDARLTTTLPEDGDYVVEISDSRYQAGPRPVYRLLIGAIPVAEEVYPLGGRRGETVGFELRGGTLSDLRVVASSLNVPAIVDGFRLQVPGSMVGLDPSFDVESTGSIAVGDLPELREPSDPNAPPVKAVAPVTINGRIESPNDEDRVIVAVNPGQTYRIRVVAADLGSALDGTLQVLKGDGAVLAQADDTTTPQAATKAQQKKPPIISADPSLNVAVPGDVKEIVLALRDLEGRGGVGFPYRITVEPVVPTFQVKLEETQVNVPKGGSAVVGVTIARQGYNGPIALAVANPPPGLTVRPGTIADGQLVGVLGLAATADAAFGPVVLDVTGTGQGPGGPIVEVATKPIVFAQQADLPTKTETQVGLAAASAPPSPVNFDLPGEPVEVVHGHGVPVTVKLARTEGNDAGVSITPLPLPPGLAVPEAKLADKAVEGPVTINVGVEAPLGPMTIGLIAKGKLGGKDRTISLPALTLNVVRPAELSLAAPTADIKPGETIEVKGKVVRKGPFKEPVTVKLNGLPAGLKADPVTVAPDASDFAFKLIAEPAAAAAMANAQAVMAFQVNKKDYATPPVGVAVKVVK